MTGRTTTAATVSGAGLDFEIADIEVDEPRGTEVLVRIEAVSVCHTDISVQSGVFPYAMPAVLGHEGAGVVEQVGPEVTRLRPGQRVSISFDFCGHCDRCVAGLPGQCREYLARNFGPGKRPDGSANLWRDGQPLAGNFFGQSTFAGYALANERNAIPVNEDLDVSPELLAPLGCGVQTGSGAILNVLRPHPGSTVVVFGAGTVGMSALMAAALLPVRRLIAVDVNAQRLALARDLGATDVVDPTGIDVVAAIKDLTGGGADYALEASGVEGVALQAFSSLGTGGTLAVEGLASFTSTAEIPLADLVNFSKHVVGVVEGASNPPIYLPYLTSLVATGKVPLGRITRTGYKLSDINAAVADMHNGEVIKPVLTP
ncbi:aryl-alcohol dehydrogenase [Kibdelosporangium aridum]|uniref:Aryl-alcohol dehydrogenase n=1 Tax=Kibdelosporangium aridum TaxID=2030 RepID=A0A1W2FX72_KIBAR|nr:aryl-alcohol dehydrogenase [Kibdelosporangium aridum]